MLYGGQWLAIVGNGGTGGWAFDTWTYHAGVWTNVTRPHDPRLWAASMAYDPVDGYVILFGGETFPEWNVALNQTWTFSDGEWSKLNVTGPPARVSSSMAWDPALGEIVLTGGSSTSPFGYDVDTWGFVHGTWTNLSVKSPASQGPDLTYLPSAGGLVLLSIGLPVYTPGPYEWLFDGQWRNLSVAGPSTREDPAFTSEPSAGRGILFGGMTEGPAPSYAYETFGDTWSFDGHGWQPLGVPGPPSRYGASIVYDASDGYVMLFGGENLWRDNVTGGTVTEAFNDTWTFSYGDVAPVVSVIVNPTSVCTVNDRSCAAGAWQATVNVTVRSVYSSGLTAAPTLDSPVLTLLPWNEVRLNESVSPVSCKSLPREPRSCYGDSLQLRVGNSTGLRVNWSSVDSPTALYVGDEWTIALAIYVVGPPYGSVPVYACATPLCYSEGSGTVAGVFSAIGFQPFASDFWQNDSLPYANITVDPPRAPPSGTSSPVGTVPAPPPTPVGLPAPVPVPAPVVLPTLTLTLVVVGVPVISLSSIAAGILGAGFARAALHHRAVALGQPVGNVVRPKPSAFESERPGDSNVWKPD